MIINAYHNSEISNITICNHFRPIVKKGNNNESSIWKLCERVYDPMTNHRYAVCKICRVKNDVTKTTSNCRKHLRTVHPIQFAKAEEVNESEAESTTTTDAEAEVETVSTKSVGSI